jgi:hypothetical protein
MFSSPVPAPNSIPSCSVGRVIVETSPISLTMVGGTLISEIACSRQLLKTISSAAEGDLVPHLSDECNR